MEREMIIVYGSKPLFEGIHSKRMLELLEKIVEFQAKKHQVGMKNKNYIEQQKKRMEEYYEGVRKN